MAANIVTGTAGDDTLGGLDGVTNYFDVWQGGADTLTGGDQADVFIFRDMLNPEDQIDGGAGNDILRLHGDTYSDGLTLGDHSLTSVENIQFAPGANYSLTTADGNVLNDDILTIDGAAIDGEHSLTFDGSAETDGVFHIVGGHGDDFVTGGASKDIFDMRDGGEDAVHGGAGGDTIFMRGTADAGDVLDGGTGSDTVVLDGIDAVDTLAWSATSLTSVERLYLQHGNDYSIVGDDANIAAHKAMIVEDNDRDPGSNTLFYDGSAETDGHYNFKPETAIATLIGGAQSDRFDGSQTTGMTVTGGGGADLIIADGGNSGATDTFIYNAASESTSTHHDTIQNVDFQNDTFIAPWGTMGPVEELPDHAMSKASFDTDLGNAISDFLAAHGATVFTANAGDLAGHSFLVIDVNGATGYQTGADIVIDVTGFTGLNT
ncbi:MAG TPA: bluetail domain-containing putative surface protein [Rhizomicrobium sp.]|jgi:Ca2+-binding RTX toxin-like protein